MLIDVQCHVFPRAYGDYVARCAEAFKAVRTPDRYLFDFSGNQFLAMPDADYDPNTVLSAMDRAGIDLSLISCNIPDPGLLPPECAEEGVRIANDEVAELVARHPGRFAGIAFLPWNVPDAARRELERVRAMGFRSVMLFSHNGGVFADDPSLEGLYARIEELELPVTIHPSIPVWSGAIGAYGLVSAAGFVIDTGFALMRLIRSGILEKFPKLKVVMPHAGGVLPYLDGRLTYVPPGVRNAAPPINRKTVPEHLRHGNIWCDTANPSEEVLAFAKRYLTPDRLMFGSDYPFVEQDVLREMAEAVFTPEEREAVFWKNADRVYGLGLGGGEL